MPRFPHLEQLAIPATFTSYVAGRLHPDGRRYLPLLVFDIGIDAPLGIVDRHHIVAPDLEGKRGTIQIVFLLSKVMLQPSGDERAALVPETLPHGRASTAPDAYGKVLLVPTWEEQRGTLKYESLYTEFLLDIGVGTVGVRTATTADSLADALGTERIAVGDWVHVGRSRIDILGFKINET